ncbi:PepSY-associated TM helix domain-containing protein [Kordiimonas aestuarii]|uniref:PepSY-associated TM helix domain-containing protein n=1 Tax=Kordiimonas aestuarii TaxID=1005925 RepID=UPI0021CF5797|nr:PepSY-associated TM helix domain-containing protein [Kordiimonas aestuarii]
MRRSLKKIHQFIGVFVAIYILVMAATGTLLVYKDAVLRLAIPEVAGTVTTLSSAQQANTLKQIEVLYTDIGVRSVKLPRPGMNAYKVYLKDKSEILLNAATTKPVHDPIHVAATFTLLFDIHHRLAMGEFGEEVVGILGLIACFSVISGMYLWWPWRKGFRLRNIVPASSRATSYRGAHVTLGAVIAPLLLLTTATGSAMIYSGQVRAALTSVFGGSKPTVSIAPDWTFDDREALFDGKVKAFPDGMATIYIPPREEGGDYTIRLKMPREWHPNGRSTISADRQLTGLTAYNASEAALGHNIADAIYPLHSGKTDSALWQLLIALSGLGAVALAYMGFAAYLKRARARFDIK